MKKLEERKSKLSKCCFNCGDENCSIAKCPKPKDPEAISKRKEEFMAAIGQRGQQRGVSIVMFKDATQPVSLLYVLFGKTEPADFHENDT